MATFCIPWADGCKSPWERLDSEESLRDDPSAGLVKYGGRVEFIVKVTESLELQQQQPQQCPSTRFGRRFGSASFVKLVFSKESLEKLRKRPDGLLNYVQRPIIIAGRVFRAYSTRDLSVFYVQTNEATSDTGGASWWLSKDPFSQSFSFLDFIRWHNPLEHNQNQVHSVDNRISILILTCITVNVKVDQSVPTWTIYLHTRSYPQSRECTPH